MLYLILYATVFVYTDLAATSSIGGFIVAEVRGVATAAYEPAMTYVTPCRARIGMDPDGLTEDAGQDDSRSCDDSLVRYTTDVRLEDPLADSLLVAGAVAR